VAEKKKLFKKSAKLRVSQQRKHISFFFLGKEVFVAPPPPAFAFEVTIVPNVLVTKKEHLL